MFNPSGSSSSSGNSNYYRQPTSTPGVNAPNPPPNFAAPPPAGKPPAGAYPPQGAPGGYPPAGAPGGYPPPPAGAPGGYPPAGAPGGYPPPPAGAPGAPPVGAGQYPPPPQQAGQYGPPPTMAAGQYPTPAATGGISLSKDQSISLSKEDPSLRRIFVGLGWDVNQVQGCPFDLDAVCFMLGTNGTVKVGQDFIFYNNKVSRDGSVEHKGDNLTGQGEGDDEVVTINLPQVSPDVIRIAFAVSIHDPETRRQSFSQVPRAFIRIANQESGRNICRYDLSNEGGTNTALIVGEVYREGPEWKFVAVGKSFPGGLKYLCQIFGVSV
ncbi:hypothetical protein SAMD00019534_107120 [Acytostelium subglobosum LB1]|uniref:hypothetical protein n=1 Tax=Acytostelium subglobosum LB1 TaxID=1410327 RepID=UPI000644913D|nr:hypothetical protein SAMD00019534_107120 [Acytostelium subglobosum LB1]GAM27536.1 hypothetical protein SAMD00019534_107120 [Acytostelium subglobosum LB1]|eukprot:XP_012749601.1 hypothetical protein SAMD00019534_107120 [Acytostelium subglobosum LB1]